METKLTEVVPRTGGRGLKWIESKFAPWHYLSSPVRGTWIEIAELIYLIRLAPVVPHAGDVD